MRRVKSFLQAASLATAVLALAATLPAMAIQGRSQNYPPDPQVNWKHLRLDLRVSDFADAVLLGKATYSVAATLDEVRELSLDSAGMEILAVSRTSGQAVDLKWTHANEVLRIELGDPLGPASDPQAMQELTFRVEYRVDHPRQGMTFSPAKEACEEHPAQGPQLHTQGQPQSNHYWFPVHDFPNIRMTTEVVIDLPAGMVASSNGRLVSHVTLGDREVWHWLQDKPHVPYLVSVVAGDFARTTIPSPLSGVPMSVWSDPARAGLAVQTYANTDRMVDCFNKAFGTRYPWDRYDQLVVRNFGGGGMENTSATTMHPGALLDEVALLEGDIDGLIAHELCHQWTGDLITCRSWEHIWLNEGWATYGTALWMEARDGIDGYYDQMLSSAQVARRDSGSSGGDPPTPSDPMCSRFYSSPGEAFGRAANPYPKGASILHMLRRSLGDSAFFAGVRLYMSRFSLKLVETDDFRHCMEEVSGRSLERFFNQWCFEPGCPRIKVTSAFDESRSELTLTVRQEARIGGAAPFEFTLPMVVRTKGGEFRPVIRTDGLECSMTLGLDSAPTMIAVDPTLDVLKVLEVDFPDALLVEQMRSAPTSASRRQAAATLGQRKSPEAVAALGEMVRSALARTSLRREAAEALNAMGSEESRSIVRQLFDELVQPTLGDSPQVAAQKCPPQVRAVLIEGVAVAAGDDALALLVGVLGKDGQYSCKVEALKGISRLGSVDSPERRERIQRDPQVLEAIMGAMRVASPGEKVRTAALEACAALGLVGLRESVVQLAQPCYPDRLRPVAIEAIGKLQSIAGQEARRAETITWLIELLGDPEPRARDGAGETLALLKATECLGQLEVLAKDGSSQRLRERAASWIQRIRQ